MVDEKNKFGALGLSIFILIFVIVVAVFNFKIARELNTGELGQEEVKSEETGPDSSFSPSRPQPLTQTKEAEPRVVNTPSEMDKTAANEVVHEPPLPSVILLQ